jgi:hypothetical protein
MATPDPRSGLDEDGRWTPVFPGQRPPFAGEAQLVFEVEARAEGCPLQREAALTLEGQR